MKVTMTFLASHLLSNEEIADLRFEKLISATQMNQVADKVDEWIQLMDGEKLASATQMNQVACGYS